MESNAIGKMAINFMRQAGFTYLQCAIEEVTGDMHSPKQNYLRNFQDTQWALHLAFYFKAHQ